MHTDKLIRRRQIYILASTTHTRRETSSSSSTVCVDTFTRSALSAGARWRRKWRKRCWWMVAARGAMVVVLERRVKWRWYWERSGATRARERSSTCCVNVPMSSAAVRCLFTVGGKVTATCCPDRINNVRGCNLSLHGYQLPMSIRWCHRDNDNPDCNHFNPTNPTKPGVYY